MQQIYFIRHGNADYLRGCLTLRGVQQVERLSSVLERLLPNGIQGTLVSSSSGRAIETANLLLPLIERKSGRRIRVEEEGLLSELRSIGGGKSMLERGKANVVLVEKDGLSDYGFFIAHENIIAATGIAIAERYGLQIPDFLRPIEDQPDEETFRLFMTDFKNKTRADALLHMKSLGWNPQIALPPIAEASAIHLDMLQKKINYILPV
jgi:hypothetical protein